MSREDDQPAIAVAHSGSPQPVPKRVRVVEDTVPDSTERTVGKSAIERIRNEHFTRSA